VKIAIGIVLALAAFAGSMGFWAIIKKKRHLWKLTQDQDFLVRFLQRLDEEESFESRTARIEPLAGHFINNLYLITKATLEADKSTQKLGAIIAIAALVGSYFISTTWIVITLGAGVLGSLVPIGEAGQQNALTTILEIAQIVFKWHRESPGDCEDLIFESPPIRGIYDAVYIVARLREI
jgi:hypothetical protein